jgi:hypothetical protein
MQIPTGTWCVFKKGERMRGGMLQAPRSDIPTMWVQYRDPLGGVIGGDQAGGRLIRCAVNEGALDEIFFASAGRDQGHTTEQQDHCTAR